MALLRRAKASTGAVDHKGGITRGEGEGAVEPALRNHLLRTRDAPSRGRRRGVRSGPAQAGEAGVGLETNRLQQYNIQYLMPNWLIVSIFWWAHFNSTIKNECPHEFLTTPGQSLRPPMAMS